MSVLAVNLQLDLTDLCFQDTQQQVEAVLGRVREIAPEDMLSGANWPSQQWGLVTTGAVGTGDALVTVPRQAVLQTDQPDQLLLQIALVAMPHASHILTAAGFQEACISGVNQARSASEHQGDATAAAAVMAGIGAEATAMVGQQADTYGSKVAMSGSAQPATVPDPPHTAPATVAAEATAEATAQDGLLADLVQQWLRQGKVQLSWTTRLALALVWNKDSHSLSQTMLSEVEALHGKMPESDCQKTQCDELAVCSISCRESPHPLLHHKGALAVRSLMLLL